MTTDLRTPPTEQEISEVVHVLNSAECRELALVVRRLAFERDDLRRRLAELAQPKGT